MKTVIIVLATLAGLALAVALVIGAFGWFVGKLFPKNLK